MHRRGSVAWAPKL